MRLFRRSRQDDPPPGSYQERLRAIGRQIDHDGLRFRLLLEMPDGFLLKGNKLAVRPQGNSGSSWVSRTFWLKHPASRRSSTTHARNAPGSRVHLTDDS